MEALIKDKMFSNAINFYGEETSDKDWRILLDSLKTNTEFKEYFLKHLTEETDLLSIHLLLSKLFDFSTPSTYDLILQGLQSFSQSNNKYAGNSSIADLVLCQIIKMGLNDIRYRSELSRLIKAKMLPNEDWVDPLLEQMEYFDELGLKHELNQDYQKAVEFYSKSGNYFKINELNETIAMINHHLPNSSPQSNSI